MAANCTPNDTASSHRNYTTSSDAYVRRQAITRPGSCNRPVPTTQTCWRLTQSPVIHRSWVADGHELVGAHPLHQDRLGERCGEDKCRPGRRGCVPDRCVLPLQHQARPGGSMLAVTAHPHVASLRLYLVRPSPPTAAYGFSNYGSIPVLEGRRHTACPFACQLPRRHQTVLGPPWTDTEPVRRTVRQTPRVRDEEVSTLLCCP